MTIVRFTEDVPFGESERYTFTLALKGKFGRVVNAKKDDPFDYRVILDNKDLPIYANKKV